jgi:hypothetical protein
MVNTGRQQSHRSASIEDDILHAIEQSPHANNRWLASRYNVSQSTEWRVLNEQLYPYHVQPIQALQSADPQHQRAFSHWLLQQYLADPNFLS